MNLSHDALRNLTALAKLKSEGRILERRSLLLPRYVIKGNLGVASSLEGMRKSLQLGRIGGIAEEEHAADVDGKVAEMFHNSGGSTTPPGSPPLRSAFSSKGKRPATKSRSAAGSNPVYRGVGKRNRAGVRVARRRDRSTGGLSGTDGSTPTRCLAFRKQPVENVAPKGNKRASPSRSLSVGWKRGSA